MFYQIFSYSNYYYYYYDDDDVWIYENGAKEL